MLRIGEIMLGKPMNDTTISRYAAINAETDELDMIDHVPQWVFGRLEKRLKQLPSAQPEIIRCKDCEWWEKQKNSLQGRCELMQMYPTGAWFCGNAKRRVDE